MKLLKNEGMMDILSIGSQQDAIILLPTLGYALQIWPIIQNMFREVHGKEWVWVSKTATIPIKCHTMLRLWVPYELDPTMPMDFPIEFKHQTDTYVTPYGLYTGRWPLV